MIFVATPKKKLIPPLDIIKNDALRRCDIVASSIFLSRKAFQTSCIIQYYKYSYKSDEISKKVQKDTYAFDDDDDRFRFFCRSWMFRTGFGLKNACSIFLISFNRIR